MKIKIIVIGKTQKSFLVEGENEYLKRLGHYIQVEKVEISDLKGVKSMTTDQIKEGEGKLILSKIETGGIVILLDENGKQKSSIELSEWLQTKMNHAGKHITFIIGGPYGFSDEVYAVANEKLSLSKMTFSHQMIRMLFLEQIYRAFTILRNEPYHHE